LNVRIGSSKINGKGVEMEFWRGQKEHP